MKLLFLLASALSSCDGATPPSFPTWSLGRANTHMEWNELPSHVSLKATEAPPSEPDLDVGETNVLVVAAFKNQTDSNPLVSEAFDETLSLLFKDCFNASAGSLSSDTGFIGNITNPCKVIGLQLGNVSEYENSTVLKNCRDIGRSIGSLVKKDRKIRVLLPHLDLPLAGWIELSTSFWACLYNDERYKSGMKRKKHGKRPEPIEVELVLPSFNQSTPLNLIQDAIRNGAAMARGVFMAKDIVQAPHNVLNAVSLADTARRVAQRYNSVLSCNVMTAQECEEKHGMGAFVAVARASETPGQFIHLTYRPRRRPWGRKLRKLGIVGKGLLFDTGGYNIKTQMMELMKFDCGGAAAVLGAACSVAELEPQGVEVHILVAACENMINEKGVLPSDILVASNGKTIEVLNTDAEGRLTMADALVYADKELKCEQIIELSTLTGACMVALGSKVAGLWSTSDALSDSLMEASEAAGEQLWRMPLVKEYDHMLKSKIADIKNIGGRYGGSITAALFLTKFVDKETPFVHIDMAGPVWDMKLGQATGWGSKLVTQWVMKTSNAALTA